MYNATNDAADVLTEAGFRRRAQQALLSRPPEVRAIETHSSAYPSDFDLNPDAIAELAGRLPQRPAAVLVPVIARAELTLLFTQRTDHLPVHAGQISFPGGKIDEQDGGAKATALREAEEEVGLSRAHIETLGYLDTYRTGTGYRITPVVALVSPNFTLTLNPGEVSDTFEVPLSFFLDAGNFRTDTRSIGGRERRFYAIPYDGRYIWGATAGILKNMHERLFGP